MTEEKMELKSIIGAMIFASSGPLKLSEIRKCLKLVEGGQKETEEEQGTDQVPTEKELRDVITGLQEEFNRLDAGFQISEVAGGYRFETDPRCGPWLKQMLKQGNSQRLSQPALETLAIIAYRQPINRGEIERIRGVSVDHVVRNLLEFQLIKIVGRSELPGKPFLYGTTQKFLQHFGLKSIKDLEDIQPMLKAQKDLSQQSSGTDESSEEETREQAESKPEMEADNGSEPEASRD
jgi:segregation and condensation protein B